MGCQHEKVQKGEQQRLLAGSLVSRWASPSRSYQHGCAAGVRWSASIGQAVASGRLAWQAVGTQRVARVNQFPASPVELYSPALLWDAVGPTPLMQRPIS